ncbi:hypothetical protein AX17_004452 [Amanita inopinata Kibby_2008]|nr:hypothetical protein AX17_004452 [Amanita inopinata Kibby_2008]
MNFFDSYDVASPSTTPTPSQPQQSLNEEVSEVLGQFGRFWGTFKKQSQAALEVARRDIGGAVNQAQKELSKLTISESSNQATESDLSATESEETSVTPTDREASSSNSSTPDTARSSQTLFSRLQSALPPNIVSTVRDNLPESLKHASDNIDFAQLHSNLLSELQRVQGVTRAQAEEYVHKSDSLLREAIREAGEVLRDAVKVVPPEEAVGSSSQSGAIWDGTDMWTIPPGALDVDHDAAGQDKTECPAQQAVETQRTVTTRAESLLKRLKRDPSIIRHDPESDVVLKRQFNEWLALEVESKEGGIEDPEWSSRTSALLAEPVDGPALQSTQDTLVPSEMSRTTFWKRFFFRAHQIAQEEGKRKALIAATVENDEEFSWEDDEDDSTVPAESLMKNKAEESKTATSRHLAVTRSSSRDGSDASYDVVSSNQASGLDDKNNHGKEEGDSEWE